MTQAPLRLLFVEDSAIDVELSMRELARSGMDCVSRRVETETDFRREIDDFVPSVILSDFSMPEFDGRSALNIAAQSVPHTPFIFVSGTIGEQVAIDMLKQGATDYLIKTNLARLPSAISRALEEKASEAERLRTAEQLRASEQRFKLVALAIEDAVWDWNLSTGTTWRNDGFAVHFGLAAGELEHGLEFWRRHVHPADRERVLSGITAAMMARQPSWTDEYRLLREDGSVAYVLDRCRFLFGESGAPERAVGAAMDLTRRKQTEMALRLTERAMESSINPIAILDVSTGDYPLTYVNPAFEKVTGYARSEVLGRGWRFMHGDADHPALERIERALNNGQEAYALVRSGRRDGSSFWNDCFISPVRDPDSGAVTHFVVLMHDVTDVKRYQDELERQANYDDLTGIANRNLFNDRLEQAIALARRDGSRFAVAFVDLDNFKLFNDSLGHGMGDTLLKAVAERMGASVRAGDTIARLGGDEFAMILLEQAGEPGATAVLHRLRHALDRPISLGGRDYIVTCSVGMALFPQDGEDGESLLRNADAAMYRAKTSGRNGFQFYSSEMNAHLGERLALDTGLRMALSQHQLRVRYQPQFDLASGRMVGVEALARWHHPELGEVSPARFIPLAEENGMIEHIGRWVLKTACADIRDLDRSGVEPLRLSINLSPRQMQKKGLAAMVRDALEENKLSASRLELEVTESAAMHDVEAVCGILTELKSAGVSISIDDFGTGYSGLAQLKRLPIDRLKIDQSFVRHLAEDPKDAAIARTVIALGHGLGLAVTAEGIETDAQLKLLKSMGCNEAQGFGLSRPLLVEDLRTFARSVASA